MNNSKISRLAFGIPTLVDLEAILFNLVPYGELTGSLPGMEAPGHFVENSVAFGKFPDMIMRTIQLVHIRLIENKFTNVNAWNEFTNVNAKPDIDKTNKILVYLGIKKKKNPRSQDRSFEGNFYNHPKRERGRAV